jgi:hypothetical protein
MVHAIADLVGQEMIAHLKFAQVDALDMESASTQPVFVNQALQDLTAL